MLVWGRACQESLVDIEHFHGFVDVSPDEISYCTTMDPNKKFVKSLEVFVFSNSLQDVDGCVIKSGLVSESLFEVYELLSDVLILFHHLFFLCLSSRSILVFRKFISCFNDHTKILFEFIDRCFRVFRRRACWSSAQITCSSIHSWLLRVEEL